MQTKLLEIRDSGTFIPVMATGFYGADHPLLRVSGFAADCLYVHVAKLQGGEANGCFDPFDWGRFPRTMIEAHLFIEKHWDELADGDVIDVQFILGETTMKKTAQTGWTESRV